MAKKVMNEREITPNIIPEDMYFSFNMLHLLTVVNKEELCNFFSNLSDMMRKLGNNEASNLFLASKNYYNENAEMVFTTFSKVETDKHLYMDSFDMEVFEYSNDFVGVSFNINLRDNVLKYLNDLLKGSVSISYIKEKYPWVNIRSDYRNYLFNYELLIIKKSCYSYFNRELSLFKLGEGNPISLDVYSTNCTIKELSCFDVNSFKNVYFDYFSDELKNGRLILKEDMVDYSCYYVDVLNKYYIDEFRNVINIREASLDKYFTSNKKAFIRNYLKYNKNYCICKSLLMSSDMNDEALKDFENLVKKNNDLDSRFNNIVSTKNISFALFLSKFSILLAIVAIMFNELLVDYVKTFIQLLLK